MDILSYGLSVLGIIVSILAIIQSCIYNSSSKKINDQTKKMQEYIENIISHSNFINMYTFLHVREISKSSSLDTKSKQPISMTKDTIVFNKGAHYNASDADVCEKIIFSSGIIKQYVYGKKISLFLKNNDITTSHITLKFELSHGSIENFLSMSSQLLKYNICVLHNIHF